MKISKDPIDDSGSILLEAVGFAALAFGLLLTMGLNLLDLERKQLGIEQITRNAFRYYILHPNSGLSVAIQNFKYLDRRFDDEHLELSVHCTPSNCSETGSFVWLEARAGSNTAKAFGVVP